MLYKNLFLPEMQNDMRDAQELFIIHSVSGHTLFTKGPEHPKAPFTQDAEADLHANFYANPLMLLAS